MIIAILRLLGLTLFISSVAIVILERDGTLPPVRAEPPPPPLAVATGPRVVRLFFGGGEVPHHVEGVLRGITLEQVAPLGVAQESFSVQGSDIRFGFSAPGNDLVGFAVLVPEGALHWALTLDGTPFPREKLFAGPFGLPAPELSDGIGPSCLDGFATGNGTPYFSRTTTGAFVICSTSGG